MFCYQCEQTAHSKKNGIGCQTAQGVCGKDATTADLQDLMTYSVKGIAQYAKLARELGHTDNEADVFILYGLFTTLTNVNFNADRFVELIAEAKQIRDRLREAYEHAAVEQNVPIETPEGPAVWEPATVKAGLLLQVEQAAIDKDLDTVGEDIVGLRAMMLYGLKGVAAYCYHAHVLGYQNEEVFERIEKALDLLASEPTDAELLLGGCLEVGAINLKVMELLDAANTGQFGAQEAGAARTTAVKGKAILVSGHDMQDLYDLLEQTKDTGINIYTHGEMLPAHAYPKLKAYPHLIGNYGTAWQNQHVEFAAFPGAIIMTSNCLIEPQDSYKDRIFTAGPVGWPGVPHLEHGDFTLVIEAAKAAEGFTEDEEEKSVMVGFGRHTVLSVADKVVEAVKSGDISHFFVVGGCDGAAPGRNYYTELVEQTPDDTVVLTLGCGKYRFNDQDLGDIGGIPRLLDVGQCNDTYSAIQIALALAKEFDCGVNDLPLSYMVSWFEQKAVAVLLSLLSLGIKGIHLGPTLPGFITPNLLNILVETFDIKPNGVASEDLAKALAQQAA